MTAPGRGGAEPAEVVAAAVRAVPGVAGLHGGRFGEVATHGVGTRVVGVRLKPAGGADVHVVVTATVPVPEVAAAVRSVVAVELGVPVDVHVEDIEFAHEAAAV